MAVLGAAEAKPSVGHTGLQCLARGHPLTGPGEASLHA
jgi:hypothetical protein